MLRLVDRASQLRLQLEGARRQRRLLRLLSVLLLARLGVEEQATRGQVLVLLGLADLRHVCRLAASQLGRECHLHEARDERALFVDGGQRRVDVAYAVGVLADVDDRRLVDARHVPRCVVVQHVLARVTVPTRVGPRDIVRAQHWHVRHEHLGPIALAQLLSFAVDHAHLAFELLDGAQLIVLIGRLLEHHRAQPPLEERVDHLLGKRKPVLVEVACPVLCDARLARAVVVGLAKPDRLGHLAVAHQLDAALQQLRVEHATGGLNSRMGTVHGLEGVNLLDVESVLAQVRRVDSKRWSKQRLAPMSTLLALPTLSRRVDGGARRHTDRDFWCTKELLNTLNSGDVRLPGTPYSKGQSGRTP